MRLVITALALATLAGCTEAEDFFLLETARDEGSYIPLQLAGTLALGVVRGSQFAEVSADVQAAGTTAGIDTDPDCATIVLLDAMGGQDLLGSVQYDFSNCGNTSGSINVTQAIVIPGLSGDDDAERDEEGEAGLPNDWDGELPPDWDGEIPHPDDLEELLAEGTANMAVEFEQYSEGYLHMQGGIAMEAGSVGGALDAALSVSALDYGGDIDVAGHWAPGLSEGAMKFSFVGDFVSSTDLGWTVDARDVELDAECMDALGGELHARYENSQGRVDVTAVFDGLCDGCATIFVDGVEQGNTCFDGSAFLGS